jgi:hypothetical protein
MMIECKYCKEPVRPDAVKCPHCQQWLSRKAMGKTLVPTLVTFFVIFFGMSYVPKLLFGTHGILLNIPPTTAIVSTKMIEGPQGYRIVGEIKNEGEDSSGSFSVEANLYDKAGKLIDTGSDFMVGNFAKGATHSFKVTFGCGKNKLPQEYDHFAVRIR